MSVPKKLGDNQVVIYNYLRNLFPDKFPELMNYPHEVSHPGNQPRAEYISSTISKEFILESDNNLKNKFKQLVTLLSESKLEVTKQVVLSLFREPVIDDSFDEDVNDSDDDNYSAWHSSYFAPPKGEVKGIKIVIDVPNPDYQVLQAKQKLAKENWEQRLKRYQQYAQRYKLVHDNNVQLFHQAISEHNNLWIAAARLLSGKPIDQEQKDLLINNKLKKLQDEIEALTALASGINTVRVISVED